jgi:hypothetical protein
MEPARFERSDPSTSCEAAVVAKPKARLCEPWVASLINFWEPRSGDLIALVLTRNSKL